MMTLLPVFLTKAFVRGHLRNLGGRMVEVKPYHTKTQPKRDDDRTRELFGDIPPAGNQIQPRMHPARTTTPRTPIIPFKTVFPQLFEEKEVATVQNGQYTKDTKGRNPAPATEETKMATLNANQKKAMSYMIGVMRTSPGWERGLYEHALRWAGFSEWSGNDAVRRYYFNDPDEPNERMFGYIKDRAVKWNGGYEGATRKPFKELNARHVQKMQAVYDQGMAEMAAYIEENRQSLPIFGEGTPGEIREVPGHPELGPYIRIEDGKWEEKADAPATTTPPAAATTKETLLGKIDADLLSASGHDKQDLDVVRAWIARTPNAPTEKEFLAAMKNDQTLAEKDAYIRSVERKRTTTEKPTTTTPPATKDAVYQGVNVISASVEATDEAPQKTQKAVIDKLMEFVRAAKEVAPTRAMDSHKDPIHGYTNSVAQLKEDRAQARKLRREMADAKAAEDADWTDAATEQHRTTWNEWLKQANGKSLSAKEIAEQEKRQGFTVDTLKRHIARHGVDKRHVATKETLLKEMEKDRKAAEGTPIAADMEAIIDLIRMTDPENRPFSETIKGKLSKAEEAALRRVQAWKKEQNAPTTPPATEKPTTTPSPAAAEQAKADRIYLTVPFAEKDRVKSKGAKWDGDKKKWYWPTSAGDMPAVVKGYAK